MLRTSTIVLLCAAFAGIASIGSAAADDSMSSGSMAALPKNHQYLIGTWSCDAHLAAMEGQPAMTDHGTMTIAVAPSLTLHFQVVAKDYMSDSYQGYNAKTKTHWWATTNIQGNATLETSTDGVVFTGTNWQGATATPVRDTQSKISDTKIRDVSEIKLHGKWLKSADVTCTKG